LLQCIGEIGRRELAPSARAGGCIGKRGLNSPRTEGGLDGKLVRPSDDINRATDLFSQATFGINDGIILEPE
jgi:hypothetical protein